MFVFECVLHGSTGGVLFVFLALTVHELRAIFFVLSQYLIDCFPVMKHWISKEASKRT